jgi:hypothetical protein
LRFVWVIVLIVGLGAGFLGGRITKVDDVLPADIADSIVTELLSDYAAAVNSGDQARIAAFYASDATMTNVAQSDPWVVRGNTDIARAIRSWWDLLGYRVEDPGTVVQKGDLFLQSQDSVWGPAMSVFQIRDGRFANHWILMASQ